MLRARSAILALVLLIGCAAVDPGLRIAFSEHGLNYIESEAVEILLKQLDNLKIPDISTSVKTPVGHVNFDLSNIVLTSLKVPNRKITLHPPSSLQDTISGVSAHVHLKWHYREKSWPHVSDHGTADVSISGSSISVDILMGEKNERPTVTCASCNVDVHSLSIKLHGGASWLYNLFVSSFTSSIKSSVNKALKENIQTLINKNAEDALSKMPIKERVDKWATVQYGMTHAPEVTSSIVTLDHLGKFVMNTNPVPFNWKPAPLPASLPNEKMIQLFISAESVLSAGHTYYHAGFFQFNVTEKDVPANFPVKLNTSSWKHIIPKLYDLYPNAAMQLQVKEMAEPKFTAQANAMHITMPFGFLVYVIDHGKLVPVFTLAITADTQGTVSIAKGHRISGNVAFLNTTITVQKSEIGNFPAAAVQKVVNELFSIVLVPLIDKNIGQGVPIPTVAGVELQNPVVIYKNDHIAVGCDLHYTPQVAAAA